MQQSIPVITSKEQTGQAYWYVYIVENRLGQFYIGVTTDPLRRIRQHRGDLKGGARALKGKTPLHFKWVGSVTDKSTAMQVEYALKQLKRPQKVALVEKRSQPPEGVTDCTTAFCEA